MDRPEWITGYVYLVRKEIEENELEHLGIRQQPATEFGNKYPIHVKLREITMLIPIPDSDGIPFDNYARIGIGGVEYNIEYPYNKLKEQLGIK